MAPGLQSTESAKAVLARTASNWKRQHQIKDSGDVGVETLITTCTGHGLDQKSDAATLLLRRLKKWWQDT